MTSDEMRQKLWWHIKQQHGTGLAAAKHWGCSPAYVSAVLNGRKGPNRVMLEALQLTPQVVYLARTGSSGEATT